MVQLGTSGTGAILTDRDLEPPRLQVHVTASGREDVREPVPEEVHDVLGIAAIPDASLLDTMGLPPVAREMVAAAVR